MLVNILIAIAVAFLIVFSFAWNRKRAGDVLPEVLENAKTLCDKYPENPEVKAQVKVILGKSLQRYHIILFMYRVLRGWGKKKPDSSSRFTKEQMYDIMVFVFDDYGRIQRRLAPVASRFFAFLVMLVGFVHLLLALFFLGWGAATTKSEKIVQRYRNRVEGAVTNGCFT